MATAITPTTAREAVPPFTPVEIALFEEDKSLGAEVVEAVPMEGEGPRPLP